ncbi:hypothetical protein [Comamonas aquatica]|uniref:hypothetical protein n=2 Tax=Comamonas aquatica TaxID=225991 RepID=UPI00244819E5|nr:hypothetical protein [Comamonas aquatica]MDH0202034.1 hypothetical protein [Comamonas aquatica]MDH0383675.1 hypothetical protein [Comamonas aquatica]MDH0494975.1 hypothetical protein [Comamonas aquatica]MDH0941812.1 hypothetical protein [Comamonas aquatica]MDH1381269.1 hypothetical protein [Comamonas aquatica]
MTMGVLVVGSNRWSQGLQQRHLQNRTRAAGRSNVTHILKILTRTKIRRKPWKFATNHQQKQALARTKTVIFAT